MKSKTAPTLKQNDIQFRYDYANTVMHGVAENTDITKLEGYDALVTASDRIAEHIFTGTLTEEIMNDYILAVYAVWQSFLKLEPKTRSYEDYEYAHAVSG